MLLTALPLAAKEYISRDGGHDLRGFGKEKYSVSLMAEYAYNRTWEHMGNIDVMAHMPVVKNVQIDARMQYQTANVWTGQVTAIEHRHVEGCSSLVKDGMLDIVRHQVDIVRLLTCEETYRRIVTGFQPRKEFVRSYATCGFII